MPKMKLESDIDLQCNLCPRNPTFSDVSHLLTHISSKSHLSNQFKLGLQAKKDPSIQDQLDAFDEWYQESNLETLLSDRLAARGGKKTTRDRKNRNAKKAIKLEAKSESSQQSSARATPIGDEIEEEYPTFRAPVPQMHQWPAAPVVDNDNQNDNTKDGNWEPSAYATPRARRAVPNFTQPETPVGPELDPSLATPAKPVEEDIEAVDEKKKPGEKLVDSDSTKLKGIYWPGMDLFDSATPEMKRMRNQKKDDNILEQMIATSRGVEPAEISYHANGEFRGSRNIFGALSTENTPERPVPSPKKRRARKPPVLQPLSTNQPKLRAPRGKRNAVAAAGKSPVKRQDPMQMRPPVFLQPPPLLNPLAAGFGQSGQRFVPSAEEDEEFRLTFGDMRKKRSFGVFQDVPEISPGQTESPLEEHRFDDFTNHTLPMFQNNSISSIRTHLSPTPVAKQNGYRNFENSNGQLETPSQIRRTAPASHVFPSQIFHDPSSNPLFTYNQNYFHSSGFGHMGFGDMRSPGGFTSAYLNDFKIINPIGRGALMQPQGQTIGNNLSAAGNAAQCPV